jgi:Family of unknown function (DUF6527)
VIPLRLVGTRRSRFDWYAEPGDVWACSWESHYYIPGRPPFCWIVALPPVRGVDARCCPWHTNERSSKQQQFWEVTGDRPRLTVSPSILIDVEGGWHGWIRDGMMTGA